MRPVMVGLLVEILGLTVRRLPGPVAALKADCQTLALRSLWSEALVAILLLA